MTKLFFPDVNVWFALAVGDHRHHPAAKTWLEEDESRTIGFCRITQLGLLRLLTSAAAMGGRPLNNKQAWGVYEGFFDDERIRVFLELPSIDETFKALSNLTQPAPKVWVDCYLASHAAANGATLVTFDRGFAKYGAECLILE